MWPFSKKKSTKSTGSASQPSDNATEAAAPAEKQAPAAGESTPQAEKPEASAAQQPAQGSEERDFGPFDGDTVDYRQYNFSDFAKGGLDLGSMMIPVPHEAEVQVEMGDDGPQMLHIVTPFGRVTPVAFAAPTTGELWETTVPQLISGMAEDGLEATTEPGPWGEEIVAHNGNGTLRVIGATGPRWMLRMTLAGPKEAAGDLAAMGREIVARTFVLRGTDPIPAGDPLPVQLPKPMVDELVRHLQAQQQQQQQQAAGGQQNQADGEGDE